LVTVIPRHDAFVILQRLPKRNAAGEIDQLHRLFFPSIYR
jgi:hypothetical protein